MSGSDKNFGDKKGRVRIRPYTEEAAILDGVIYLKWTKPYLRRWYLETWLAWESLTFCILPTVFWSENRKKCFLAWAWDNETVHKSYQLGTKWGTEISQGVIFQAECLLLQKAPKDLTLACSSCARPSFRSSCEDSFLLSSSHLSLFFSVCSFFNFSNTRNAFIYIKF